MLTVDDVCKRLRCSPRTVYKLIHSGELRAHKNPGPNGRFRVSEDALEAWLQDSLYVAADDQRESA